MLGEEETSPPIAPPQEANAPEEAKLITLTFEKAGPLGIRLSAAHAIERLEEHGLASGCELLPGDVLVEVGGKLVDGFSLDQIVDLLSRRPVVVSFSRGGLAKDVPASLASDPAIAAVSNFGSKMFSWGRSLTAKSLEVASDVTKKTSEFAEKQGLGDLGNKASQVVSDLGTKATDLGTKVGSATQQGLKDVGTRVGSAAQQARDEGLGKAVGSVAQDTIGLTTKVTKQVVDVTVDVGKKTAEVAVDVGKMTAEHADVIVQGFRESLKADAQENAKVQEMMATEITEEKKKRYLVDNAELGSPNPGLGFRIAPSLGMTDPDEKVAPWGTIVEGVPCDGEWLKIGQQAYLPISLAGKLVLKERGDVSPPEEKVLEESSSSSSHQATESHSGLSTQLDFEPPERVTQPMAVSPPVSAPSVSEISAPVVEKQLTPSVEPIPAPETNSSLPAVVPNPSQSPQVPPEAQTAAPKRRALV